MRKYEAIWVKIKSLRTPDEFVEIICPAAKVDTITQMVSNEKYRETKRRRQLGLPDYGKLRVDVTPYESTKRRVRFYAPANALIFTADDAKINKQD